MIPNVKAIIWDLDDTLINTQNAVTATHSQLLEYAGISSIKTRKQLLKTWVRLLNYYDPKDHLGIIHALQIETEVSLELDENTLVQWAQSYREHIVENMELEEGALEVLLELKRLNIPMGIVSNGDRDYQLNKIKKVNLDAFFSTTESIIIMNSKQGKPHPDGIITCCSYLNVIPSHTIYIGDKNTDIIAASLANAISIKYNRSNGNTLSKPILKIETPNYSINALHDIIKFAIDMGQ